jgi:hypothetical protein
MGPEECWYILDVISQLSTGDSHDIEQVLNRASRCRPVPTQQRLQFERKGCQARAFEAACKKEDPKARICGEGVLNIYGSPIRRAHEYLRRQSLTYREVRGEDLVSDIGD